MPKQNEEAILELLVSLCAAATPRGKQGDALVWHIEYDKLNGGRMYVKINDEVYTLEASAVVTKFKEVRRKREDSLPVAEEGTYRYVKGGES